MTLESLTSVRLYFPGPGPRHGTAEGLPLALCCECVCPPVGSTRRSFRFTFSTRGQAGRSGRPCPWARLPWLLFGTMDSPTEPSNPGLPNAHTLGVLSGNE